MLLLDTEAAIIDDALTQANRAKWQIIYLHRVPDCTAPAWRVGLRLPGYGDSTGTISQGRYHEQRLVMSHKNNFVS